MQLQAFPSAISELCFDDVVPKATSTRRVAAAAFYHCLGMSMRGVTIMDHGLTSERQCCRQRTL